MSTKSGGLRSAFESQYSSLSNVEYLASDKSVGSWDLHIYGSSETGGEKSTLGDNLYMDGIYMKEYKFSSYSKEIRIDSDRGLYILSALEDEDDLIGKELIGKIDQNRAEFVVGSPKECQKNLSSFLCGLDRARRANHVSGGKIGLGAIILNEKGIAGLSMGGVGVYMLTDDGSELIDIGGTVKNRNISVGGADEKPALSKPVTELPQGGTFVLCSPFIADKFSTGSIASEVAGRDPKSAVKLLSERAAMFADNHNVSCMIITIKPNGSGAGSKKKNIRLKSKKALISLVAAAVVLLAAGGFTAAHFRNGGDDDIEGWTTADQSRLNGDEYQVSAMNGDLKPYTDEIATGKYEVLKDTKYNETYQNLNNEFAATSTMIQDYSNTISVIKGEKDTQIKYSGMEKLESNIQLNYTAQFDKLASAKAAADQAVQAYQQEKDQAAAAAAEAAAAERRRKAQQQQSSGSSSSSSGGSSAGSSSSGGSSSRYSGSSGGGSSFGSSGVSSGGSSGAGSRSGGSSGGGSSSGGSRSGGSNGSSSSGTSNYSNNAVE